MHYIVFLGLLVTLGFGPVVSTWERDVVAWESVVYDLIPLEGIRWGAPYKESTFKPIFLCEELHESFGEAGMNRCNLPKPRFNM